MWLWRSWVQVPLLTPQSVIGVSPSGKARDFDSRIRRFESCHPCHQICPKHCQSSCDPLAQSVEHLTFNQGVRSSNLRWITRNSSQLWLWRVFSFSGDSNDIVHVRRFALAEPHGHIKRTCDSKAVESPMDHQKLFATMVAESFFFCIKYENGSNFCLLPFFV